MHTHTHPTNKQTHTLSRSVHLLANSKNLDNSFEGGNEYDWEEERVTSPTLWVTS